jgi:hypothetical protein
MAHRPPAPENAYPIMEACFMCAKGFQMGPHRYDGKVIRRYQISVCSGCWGANWDGWAPHLERRLISHLAEKEIEIPARNEKGWLPRE